MVTIAIFSISLGLAVMIIALAVVTGFKHEIRNKVTGFDSHIRILNHDSNVSYQTRPVDRDRNFLGRLRKNPSVRHIQVFAIKPGIIRGKEDIQGVVLKGIGHDFDWSFFDRYLVTGSIFHTADSMISNRVVISANIASLLKLDTGDDFIMYFMQDPPRTRRFTVSGIYETSLEEFDRIFVLADIRHIQKLSGWNEDQVSGFEVFLRDFQELDAVTSEVRRMTFGFAENGTRLKVVNIRDSHPQIFDWLGLMDMNVLVILFLMLLVAGFNMISGLLIMILERTGMIGILKAMGTTSAAIRRIFLYQSVELILRGLLWGNLIGISCCLLQKHFDIIRLDQASYYLTSVPINLDLLQILALNLGTCAIITLMLIIPSSFISRVRPVTAIRFN